MTKVDHARDAVRRFARELQSEGPSPSLIRAQLHGEDGMASLCVVETAIAELWPPATAKEFIWLAHGAARHESLQLQAFAVDGRLLAAAAYDLAGDHEPA